MGLEHPDTPDVALYPHQSALYRIQKAPPEQRGLVLYTAPTGMGKTITPIMLAGCTKVVFVCAARHVCLALAQKSIAAGIGVAFAFGCNSPADVRLQHHAVNKFGRTDAKTGNMKEIDHLDGTKVQLCITDLGSVLHLFEWLRGQRGVLYDPAQYALFWDEPTIAMDAAEHPLHEHLRQMWRECDIPFRILSSATLPDEAQLAPMLDAYKARFPGRAVHAVHAEPGEGTVSVLDPANHAVMPHHYCADRAEAVACAAFLEAHPAVLRYLDLKSVLRALSSNKGKWEHRFPTPASVSAQAIKRAYVGLLPDLVGDPYRHQLYESTIDFMGRDARHFVGPCIFLAQDVAHIAQFCAQRIPTTLVQSLQKNLAANDEVREKVDKLRKLFEDGIATENEKKVAAQRLSPANKKILASIDALLATIQPVELPPRFVPNSAEHRAFYQVEPTAPCFTSQVDAATAGQILQTAVPAEWKILLLAGVGVFFSGAPAQYAEIVKRLAGQKKLFLIIADSDYIYGTNYPFFHAFVAKDLKENLSQQKLLQACGRVGRFYDRKTTFTVFFRDPTFGRTLFFPPTKNVEADVMNSLFC
jgi:hypothetical protein